ncbi:hypothetical protein BX661DRAFT_171580 [Kickxella alabastrina]|uniref:uncharacterized protein n=1 Tax=Kickxella alabastrina TaxID=61397 RepID=UPI00221EA47E|nr:uncharacterized protein BX661DRAFT_171580 [Kickxella alabastrina]KAI7826299.1 hypothetical protein BX661DRAFT_171580 [Kickxella alabastrina]
MGVWYSPEYIRTIVQKNSNMATFRSDIENTIHAVVHIHIGGNMGAAHSPNDWAFMLHYANVDCLWWQRQQLDNHLWTMDGPNHDGAATTLSIDLIYFDEPTPILRPHQEWTRMHNYDPAEVGRA